MTAEALQPEVAKWKPAGIDAVVWDRAPTHQALTRQPQDMTLILPPPRSPELNPAERVIEAIRPLRVVAQDLLISRLTRHRSS